MTVSTAARRLALIGVLALTVSVLPLAAAFAQDDPTPDQDTFVDLDGSGPSEYSVVWSQFVFDSAPEVLIGRDDVFADNLASGLLQGQASGQDHGRPLFLTPSDALNEAVADEIAALGADTVHVLGGLEAIGQDVRDALEADGFTLNEEFQGETRIETAIAISGAVESDTVIVARAFANEDPTQAWADSIAAGAWAAETGWPVLLTQTEVLTGNTADRLTEAGYENAFVVGGTEAVSADTFAEIEAIVPNVERVSGPTRFDTAVAVAAERGFASADDAEVTTLVDGQGADAWADGFSAAAFSALWDSPVVLANSASDTLPQPTIDFLEGADAAAAAFAQDGAAEINDLDPDVGLVCGPSVPDGKDPDTEPDQCGDAADIRGLTTRVDVGVDPGPGPDPTDPDPIAPMCDTEQATFNAAPELTGLTFDGTVATFTFDSDVPGQALNFALVDPNDNNSGRIFYNLRLYDFGGIPSFPFEARIEGNTVIARFTQGAIDTAVRAGINYDTVESAEGIPSTKGACAIRTIILDPTITDPFVPDLVGVGNYRLGDVIIGGAQDVLVDFLFNGTVAQVNGIIQPGDTETNYVCPAGQMNAGEFYLIGSNSAVYQGQCIISITAQGDQTLVTIDFADDPTEIPASQLRRGMVVVGETGGVPDPGFDDYPFLTDPDGNPILTEEFAGTDGLTTDPDLLSVERVNATTYRFEFDEAISDDPTESDAAQFIVFDSDGNTTVATAVARSALTEDGARVMIVTFPALPTEGPGTPVGAFVANPRRVTDPDDPAFGQAAVLGTDNTQGESDGFNRPAEVVILPPETGEGETIAAGTTLLPDLLEVIRDQNEVTQNYSISFVFDQALDATAVATTSFELFDENGTQFEVVGVRCGPPAQTPGVVACGANGTVTFSIDQEFAGFSNEDIAAAVSGGVETNNFNDPQAGVLNPDPNYPQLQARGTLSPDVTEGYFGITDA